MIFCQSERYLQFFKCETFQIYKFELIGYFTYKYLIKFMTFFYLGGIDKPYNKHISFFGTGRRSLHSFPFQNNSLECVQGYARDHQMQKRVPPFLLQVLQSCALSTRRWSDAEDRSEAFSEHLLSNPKEIRKSQHRKGVLHMVKMLRSLFF